MSEYKAKKFIMLVLIFLITGGIFLVSCAKKDTHTGHSIRQVRSDETGKEVVCPVTKNKFKITSGTKAIEYKGEIYYFCCPGCDSKFIKEPEKYISQALNRSIAESPNRQILYWTCSMHPQVRSDKPGKCPICGMNLIPIYKGEEDKIVVDEKTKETIGIKSQMVKKTYLTKTVRLPAKVAYDNDLYLAQQEYLSALRTYSALTLSEVEVSSYQNLKKIGDLDADQKNRVRDTLESAKFRLSLLGYTEDDIRELEQFLQPDKNLIYPGKNVWMHAEIYEYDLSMVKPGQNVTATTPAYPSEKFTGTVRFIEPVLNPQTRSARARIVFDNPEGKLKLEMYADLEIKVSLGKYLSVPETALIDTGTRKIVYLDLGEGRYKMKEVQTGFSTEGYVQILNGLKEGDMVVTDGNFMLDSQSTLTGGQSLLYGGAEEIKEKKSKSATGSAQGGEHKH